MSKQSEVKKDLETVDKVNTQFGDTIRPLVDAVCAQLVIDTAAGKEFVRYSLANALLMNRKQKDYGPHNISEFGVYGCLIRMSDKLKRIVNLMNNRKRRNVNESIADSFRDLSNYGIIAQIVDDGKWPTS